jgi:hypothetical protein
MAYFNNGVMTPIAEDAIRLGLDDLRAEFDAMTRPSIEEVKQAAMAFCSAYEQSEKQY